MRMRKNKGSLRAFKKGLLMRRVNVPPLNLLSLRVHLSTIGVFRTSGSFSFSIRNVTAIVNCLPLTVGIHVGLLPDNYAQGSLIK